MYNFEERTLKFSKEIIKLLRGLSKDHISLNLISQCSRSATSIGANYREANDCLGKKDFIHRLKISRKEAKETIYWLNLLKEYFSLNAQQIDILQKECTELLKILSAIIIKSENKS